MLYRLLSAALLVFALSGCASESTEEETVITDTIAPEITEQELAPLPPVQIGDNERFRNITVAHNGNNQFTISGQATTFEATLNWAIEDGHNQLDSGFTTASVGAPEWGDFSFTVTAPPDDPNTTMHIILYEASAEDGRRLSELPVPLY